jgi:hypothetical protein
MVVSQRILWVYLQSHGEIRDRLIILTFCRVGNSSIVVKLSVLRLDLFLSVFQSLDTENAKWKVVVKCTRKDVDVTEVTRGHPILFLSRRKMKNFILVLKQPIRRYGLWGLWGYPLKGT